MAAGTTTALDRDSNLNKRRALIMICGSHTDTVATRSRRSRTMVDLLIAYSKQVDRVSELVSTVERLRVGGGERTCAGECALCGRDTSAAAGHGSTWGSGGVPVGVGGPRGRDDAGAGGAVRHEPEHG